MSDVLGTAVAGAMAGLGVALPMGAIGVLLVQEALRDRRGAVAAAVAVALVDMGYAGVATALGPLVASALSDVEGWVRLISALVLGVIAVRGVLAARIPAPPTGPPAPPPSGPGGRQGGDYVCGRGGGSPARVFLRFAVLTSINPTTALYFAALTTAQGAALHDGGAGVVFVAAVFVASLLWQLALVGVSAYAGARLPDTARRWTFRLGFALVAVYAVKVALPLPSL